MKGKTQPNRSVENEGGKEGADNQFSREFAFGDVIWVKLRGSSWWPAQVVDENTVSGSSRPSNRSVGDALVRLYGSYKYMFVDPIKCCSEFKIILEKNNGSYNEILKKTLEQDLARLKSGRSKEQGSNPKAKVSCKSGANTTPKNVKNGNLLSETPTKEGSRKRMKEEKDLEPKSPKSVSHPPHQQTKNDNTLSATTSKGKSQVLSARKLRVMQSLGLVAPFGSPFHRNGFISPS